MAKLGICIICLTFLLTLKGYRSSLMSSLKLCPLDRLTENRYLAPLIHLIIGTIQTGMPNSACFMVARLLTGVAMDCMKSATPVLIAEVATLHWDWAWRFLSILQFLMPALALPGLWLVPESPRWMVSVGRVAEARQALADHHAGGDDNAPWVGGELRCIQDAIIAEMAADKESTWAELVRTPGNRHRLFITVTLGFYDQWAGNGPLSYSLSFDQVLISACLQIWNLFFALGAALSVERMGRRKLFLLSAGVILVSYIVMTGLSGSFESTANSATGIAMVPFIFIYFAGYDIALTPLLTAYPCEIWPFRLRSRGLMVAWLSCIVAVIFNTFVNPIAMDGIGWKYYIVYVCLLIIWCVITYFWYPEPRGLSLEDVALRSTLIYCFSGPYIVTP
ncbi:hypothetical protein BDW74DRAFT_189051 [Aspergillus multicolor]|uniref:uncharacterized protein n=1 Tax=Aspergillus multicolor TaxID=41759 RepID=UPI003CCD2553